jgi:hypothetical protein
VTIVQGVVSIAIILVSDFFTSWLGANKKGPIQARAPGLIPPNGLDARFVALAHF